MTITADTPTFIQIAGNGSATSFAFPFKVFAATDVLVAFVTGSGYAPQGSGYTVQNVDVNGGGNVVFSAPPPNGVTVDIRSLTPQIQPTEFSNLGSFLPENHTEAFDRVTRVVQDLYRLAYQFGIHGPDQEGTPWPSLPSVAARANGALLFDAQGMPVIGQPVAGTITGSLIAGLLNFVTSIAPTYDRILSAGEAAAGLTPVNFSYVPYDFRREGQLANNSADDTTAINNTLLAATQSVNGALGNVASFPATGVSILSSMVTLPNRVRVLGANTRGSSFQAKNTHPGPWMFNAKNGTSSMFDSTLENVTVDCNNVFGLGGILSDAWQDGCGLREVLILNFATIAIKFQNGYGGAARCLLDGFEIFGGTAATTAAGCWGIDVEMLSIAGAFMLIAKNGSITGLDGTHLLDRGINIVNDSLTAENVHFEYCSRSIYLNGNGNSTIIGCNGSTTVSTLIEIDALFYGTVRVIGCARNGTSNFIKDNRLKQIAVLGTVTGGSGYVNGTYNNVPLTGGSGTLAQAQIVVSGGAVTSVSIAVPGTNYAVADALSASNTNLGGSGSGFSVPVQQLLTGVGTISTEDDITLGRYDIASRSQVAAAAWGLFDGTATGTNAPTNGFNVKTVQRTGAGRYTVTLSRAMANANCAPIASVVNPALTVAAAIVSAVSFTISVNNISSGLAADSSEIHFVTFGN